MGVAPRVGVALALAGGGTAASRTRDYENVILTDSQQPTSPPPNYEEIEGMVSNPLYGRTSIGSNVSEPLLSPGPLSPGLLSPGLLSPGLLSPGPLSPGPLSPGPLSPGPQSPGPLSLSSEPSCPARPRYSDSEVPSLGQRLVSVHRKLVSSHRVLTIAGSQG